MSTNERYPIEKQRYMQSIGRLLPHRIGQVLKALGFTKEHGYVIHVNKGQSNGADLKISRNGHPVLAAEIFNWCINSTLNSTRQYWVISNLEKYGPGVTKVIIHSPFSDETMLEAIRQHGIHTHRIGFQILPKSFYDFFASRNQVISRRIDSRTAFEELKTSIVLFLSSLGLEIPSTQ